MPLMLDIDAGLLDGQLFLQIYGSDITTVDALTDELVKTWIDSVLAAQASTTTKSDLDDTVKTLHMNMQKKRPHPTRVSTLYQVPRDTETINRHDFVNDHPRDAVVHIVSWLQPAELKIRVSSDLEFDRKALKKHFLRFFKYCQEEAVSCERSVAATRSDSRHDTP